MKERPILFNGDMVRAILSGEKTQTRRMVSDRLMNKFQVMSLAVFRVSPIVFTSSYLESVHTEMLAIAYGRVSQSNNTI